LPPRAVEKRGESRTEYPTDRWTQDHGECAEAVLTGGDDRKRLQLWERDYYQGGGTRNLP